MCILQRGFVRCAIRGLTWVDFPSVNSVLQFRVLRTEEPADRLSEIRPDSLHQSL